MTLQKAKFRRIDGSLEQICQFNPENFSVKHEAGWKLKATAGEDTPPEIVFTGGQGGRFDIPLFFDSTDTGTDVRRKYRNLIEMMRVDAARKDPKTGKGEPPRCRFEWGSFLNTQPHQVLVGVIQSLKQDFSMFKEDGTPLRAAVTVSFLLVPEKPKGQNPTSRSEPRGTWVVQESQTLSWIAYREYGDPAAWRHIAETNDLDDPTTLRPGQILKLVPLP